MSAYRPGFAQRLIKDQSSLLSTGSISPSSLNNYELLMAEDEVMMTRAGDNIHGLLSTTALALSLGLSLPAPYVG